MVENDVSFLGDIYTEFDCVNERLIHKVQNFWKYPLTLASRFEAWGNVYNIEISMKSKYGEKAVKNEWCRENRRWKISQPHKNFHNLK